MTAQEDTIERAARALFLREHPDLEGAWDAAGVAGKRAWRHAARIMLAAADVLGRMTAHAPRGATNTPRPVHQDPDVVREAQTGVYDVDFDACVPCQWEAQECAIPATKGARTTCTTCTTTRTYCGAHAGAITRLLASQPRRCRTCGARMRPPYVEWRDL